MTRRSIAVPAPTVRQLSVALLVLAAGCGGPQKLGDLGATCFRDDDCSAGLVCVAPKPDDSHRVCSNDTTPLISMVMGPDYGGMGGGALAGAATGGGGAGAAGKAAGGAPSGGASGAAGNASAGKTSGGGNGGAASGGSAGTGGSAGSGGGGAAGTAGSAGSGAGTAGSDTTGGAP